MENNRKGYKGFGPGLVCRGKQYAENTVFEEPTAEICHSGMHYCTNPLDVLDYYPLIGDNGELNEFAEVEALDEPKTDDGKKFCTTKLRIGAKLSFKAFVNASIDIVIKGCKKVSRKDSAQLASSGYSAQLASSGYSAQLASSGYSAQLASSGYSAKLASSGDYAKLASSGDYAKLASSGKDSIAAAIGANSIVKGATGNWLVLAEWAWIDNEYKPVCVKTVQVDGEKIKADTWYKLENGEFVEVSRND